MIDHHKLTNWYDFQAPFYRLWRNNYEHFLVRHVGVALRESGARRVLDAGCGTGLFTIGLAKLHPGWWVDGIDASTGMLAVARQQARRIGVGNIAFYQGDVTSIPSPPGTYDGLVAAGLLPNLNDWSAALREFHRVLGPHGRLLVVEFDRASMTGAARLFFRLMIFGYKATSYFVRRFRFADDWSLQTTTVNEQRLERELRSAGFGTQVKTRQGGHLVFQLTKSGGD
jgi:ubiquinone/menaquinone biosynthesis C-methylase UbiE